MMIDFTNLDGLFAVLAAAGTLMLGIANIALVRPPVRVEVKPRQKQSVRIFTGRTLW
jgi:hypothetical protein